MNDIYATSLAGSYETHDGATLVERGRWSYRGYGNAEVAMEAKSERAAEGLGFSLEFHSVESRADRVDLAIREGSSSDRATIVRASLAGHSLDVTMETAGDRQSSGTLNVPEDVIFDGPSPVWMIHTMIVEPIPADREVTVPVIRFGVHPDEELTGGVYRFTRSGDIVSVEILDAEGESAGGMTIELYSDGCPKAIRSGSLVTEILRDPMILS